ncbi:MAG: phosphoribosylamine--glycine ligase [Patescibacteria group bacterium]
MNILLIGSGAREHAIARAIKRSKNKTNLFCFGSNINPGIKELCAKYTVDRVTDVSVIVSLAQEKKIDWCIVGPENPLEAGVADALQNIGIASIGPTKKLAQLETSKSFTRDLLTEYNIQACPKYKFFTSMVGVENFIESLDGNYVVKCDSLMGGKGVKVSGDHLATIEEGLEWCEELIQQDKTFLIEEKLIGQEFSLMSFSDGTHLAHMPVVQDHKRAFVGDTGPNTGGMGSYSDSNHSLPFLTDDDTQTAQAINQATIAALRDKFSEGYKGILYGGFMATKDGVKLIEYNARFGDPECMNVIAILESDFVELCQAIMSGNLTEDHASFVHKATVCKYAVPEGYPDAPIKNQKIDVANVQNKEQLYFAAVDERENGLYETGSRTVAVVGIADTIAEAEKIAEDEIQRVQGPLFHREDIGTAELVKKRVEMIRQLKNPKS